MNDFTKQELQYFLMCMKPFHWLWQNDPLVLESKIQSMIDNYSDVYCEHDYQKTLSESGMYFVSMCSKCLDSKPWVDGHE